MHLRGRRAVARRRVDGVETALSPRLAAMRTLSGTHDYAHRDAIAAT